MRISCLQIDVRDRRKEENVENALALLDQAPASDLYLLPEIWPCGYFSFDRYERDSEPLDGPTAQAMREKAVALRAHLLMGSFVERDKGNLYNTSILLNPRGEIAATYRKIHLFGYQSKESKLLTRGSNVTVADLPWGKAGLATCYDLRFPEFFRLMMDRGATHFLVVSAWPLARLEAWKLFNRARAHENLAFLISCNCAGASEGVRFAGHSSIVDPMGVALAQGDENGGIVSHEVDFSRVDAARQEFPALTDRVFRTIQ
ncbi:MAG: carbon-nitrogen family hydrolase [Candidatus Sumerlaeota bacterium]|nr:carbon-nitrogen family hydrolase [Candidatus Sumerlaeota bacterium]